MRTIEEIKKSITDDFMRNQVAAEQFGFALNADFSSTFSRVSIINILFYIFASASWVLESIFEAYSQEVDLRIDSIIPHRPKWYRDKALAFMVDTTLITDTDVFDVTGMTEEEIADAHVVKHAVAVESSDASILTIKVAGVDNEERTPLPEDTEEQLRAYFREIKDAGVRINLVNLPADVFNCDVDIYYDPILLPEKVRAQCQDAVVNYIENLPFNGEYTNMSLIDALQFVEGVRIAQFRQASSSSSQTGITVQIEARYVPEAGYFKAGNINLNMVAYE